MRLTIEEHDHLCKWIIWQYGDNTEIATRQTLLIENFLNTVQEEDRHVFLDQGWFRINTKAIDWALEKMSKGI